MVNVIIKTIVIYFFAMLAIRLMGKRQAGQLQPFELIIAIMIAEVASTPMDGAGTPITYGLVPIIVLLTVHNLIAFISMKSQRARSFFSGRPSIIINKGVICYDELKRLNYNLNDLLEQIRAKDVIDISDVHYAVLETNGELSLLLKPQKRPMQPEDMNLSPQNPGFCYDIVMDGKVKQRALDALGYTQADVMSVLSRTGMQIKNVLIATSDETGRVFIQDKSGHQATGSIIHG
jgi:uncharacterized membrane protein YcaP (DUF421 family)